MARYPTSNQPLTTTNVGSLGDIGILENFSGEILLGLFGFAYTAYILYTILPLL